MAHKAPHPRLDIRHAALEARRQPPSGPGTVEEPSLAVARLPTTTRAPHGAPRIHGGLYPQPAVLDLGGEHHPLRVFGYDDHAAHSAAGVDLYAVRMHNALLEHAVVEDDGEGVTAIDAGAALLEELPSARRRAGIQGPLVLVEYQDSVLHDAYASLLPLMGSSDVCLARIERLVTPNALLGCPVLAFSGGRQGQELASTPGCHDRTIVSSELEGAGQRRAFLSPIYARVSGLDAGR